MTDGENLIVINNCRIDGNKSTVIPQLSWTFKSGEAWLIIGPNGGGKADFLNALSGQLTIVPNSASDSDQQGLYSNKFKDSCEIVSLERAARLIQEERENDESEFIEGGVDIGRTGRIFIAEGVLGKIKKGEIPPLAKQLDAYPEIKLCGVQKILDRGLKYMSTGEIRRTLLARALVSGKELLILSDPFAGLDAESRRILLEFFTVIVTKQKPAILLSMERWHEIPSSITNVLEFSDKKISFCGTRADYEKLISERKNQNEKTNAQNKKTFEEEFKKTIEDGGNSGTISEAESTPTADILVEMHNVNVGWGDHAVLRNLNWTLRRDEHWLLRGPNGSGKTTFLELITGDNMQVFSNDIKIFGNRRGSGESIWDIKKRLGIVSYRMHVEYRMLGGTSLLSVIISGLRDSIGLYGGAPTDMEIATAKKWLALGGFVGRESESFGSLSYGEQRAVLILRSAVKTPEILILDEPCHGLDEQYREKILQLMELIGNSGTTTMLHVTHDPSEVLECEKHILELCPDEDPMYRCLQA